MLSANTSLVFSQSMNREKRAVREAIAVSAPKPTENHGEKNYFQRYPSTHGLSFPAAQPLRRRTWECASLHHWQLCNPLFPLLSCSPSREEFCNRVQSHPAVPDDGNQLESVRDSEIPGQRGEFWCEEIQESGIFARDNEKSGTTRSGTAGCDCTMIAKTSR